MKNAATSSIRAIKGTTSQIAARSLSTSASCSVERYVPKLGDRREPKFQQRPDEDSKEAWRRNMRDVREWRRKNEGLKQKVSLYLPPGVEGSAPKNVPLPPKEASLTTLLASGAALGHAQNLLMPAFAPYVYGNRSGLSVIDLEQTLPMLRRAASLVRDVVKADGKVLFIAKNGKALGKVKERLEDNAYTAGNWMPGMLTNAETLFGLRAVLDGSYLPDLVFFTNPVRQLSAIRECNIRNVPTVGIIDSDTDPRLVTYAIPANASSPRTAELILGALSIAGQEGRRMRLSEAAQREERKRRDTQWRRSFAQQAAEEQAQEETQEE